MGDAIRAAGARSVDQIEDRFCTDGAVILALSPELAYDHLDDTHRRPL